MVSALNTGVPLAGGTVNSPGTERQSENLLFGPLSSNLLSHKIVVHESPVVLKAFNLNDTIGVLYLNMVTEQADGELMDLMWINETVVALTSKRNTLVIDLPGVYRLQCLNSGLLGSFTVVSQTTAMSYWSWGLAAYGNAVAVANPIPPP